jgi:hypothetical protein
MNLLYTLVTLILTAGAGQCQTPAAETPGEPPNGRPAANTPAVLPPPAPDAPQAEPAPIEPAHAVLDRVERDGAAIRAFTATVYYEHWEDLLARREIRTGQIIYEAEPAAAVARRSFAILFDRLIVGDRAQRQQKHYIFSDRWLVEVDHEARQFIKRELVPPGRRIDPLKLGEGPIPLPIGQPKHEVLARFDVAMIDVPEEGPLRDLANVDGLRLVPKPDAPEARDYMHIDLFYDRETALPLGIAIMEVGDNRKTIRLRDVERKVELAPEQRAMISIAEPDPREWAIDVQPLRQ